MKKLTVGEMEDELWFGFGFGGGMHHASEVFVW
jgi:hypothetical protein